MVPRSRGTAQLRPQLMQRTSSANSAKQSYRSHSSSFEADDERSSSADYEMGPEAFRDDSSQYAGEDTRLTSRKELAGWYTYSFAAEVFVICGIGGFRSSSSFIGNNQEVRSYLGAHGHSRELSPGRWKSNHLISEELQKLTILQAHSFPLPWNNWHERTEFSFPTERRPADRAHRSHLDFPLAPVEFLPAQKISDNVWYTFSGWKSTRRASQCTLSP